MRHSILLFFVLFCGLTASHAQILDPVKWNMDYKQVNELEFDLIFTATIDDGWAIYSQYLENDDGPIRTSFEYDTGAHFQLKGKNEESGNRKEAFDKMFEMNLIKFFKKAVFTQRVAVPDISKPITGFLEFMTCDDTRCLPPDQIDFEFKLKRAAAAEPAKAEPKKETPKKESPQPKKEPTPEKSSGVEKLQKASDKAQKKVLGGQTAEAKKDPAPAADHSSISGSTDQKSPDTGKSDSGILEPVKWDFRAKSLGNDEYLLAFKARIDDGWHIYSQFMEEEEGEYGSPIPMGFYWNEDDPNLEVIGKTQEKSPKKIKEYDQFFRMNLTKFKKEVTVSQKVKIKDSSKPLRAELEYQTCDATKCLPPAVVPFMFEAAGMKTYLGEEVPEEAPNIVGGNTSSAIKDPYPSEIKNVDLANPAQDCGEVRSVAVGSSLWNIFLLGFFGGLIALLTPCVFPMIPLTVSFFTKGSENKRKGLTNAIMYGFFIFLVYILLSIPFHLMDSINPDILNDISTNVWLNLFFFAIFVFFAFSFFGYYELTLPESWTNKASSAEGVGGMLGIFFMALTLALVSFSCTGPILGSLLAGALTSDGGAMQLTAGMGGFGLALALPFALFAAFPSWMNSLPKSGGWLNTVKVVLGFLELALALKFLSNADMVKKWGLLKIEPFLILWIVIFIGMALYLFGKIRFPHDSPNARIGIGRKVLGVLSVAFAIYLATGFRFNEDSQSFTSLSLLSGLAPPTGYSWVYPKKCPNNLDCFKDLEAGWAYAKKVNKPMLIDFTGHACVNCRKMEELVWPKEQVIKYLRNDYVLVSLYVDEKIDLPEAEQKTVEKPTGGTRKLRTTGSKWQHLQYKYFNSNAQPQYALVSPEGTLLTKPVPYTPDVDEYAHFLECGLQAFEKVKGGKKVLGEVSK